MQDPHDGKRFGMMPEPADAGWSFHGWTGGPMLEQGTACDIDLHVPDAEDVVALDIITVDAVARYHDLVFRQAPALDSEMIVRFGCHELELAQTRTSLHYRKRFYELAQEQLENEGDFDAARIDAELADEMQSFREKEKELERRYVDALDYRRRHYSGLDEDGERELRGLYRDIVSRLDPQLNEVDRRGKRLFKFAVAAYCMDDLVAIKSIDTAARCYEPYDHRAMGELSEDEAEIEVSMREVVAGHYLSCCEHLESMEPLTYRSILEDPDLVEERMQCIRTEIDACKNTIETYERRLATMLERNGYKTASVQENRRRSTK